MLIRLRSLHILRLLSTRMASSSSASAQPSTPPTSTTNALINEKSPYLLQHRHNPVNWRPWSPMTIAIAQREDKLIFLSIGYSSCHWCHVMAHESFEDRHVARTLNRHYVSIKVDREERPDVDKLYMTYVQATSGGGGWPLSVWLTPSLQPIYGGTYFPKARFDMINQRLATLWQHANADRRAEMTAVAAQTMTEINETENEMPTNNTDNIETILPAIQTAYQQIASSYDEQHGGFADHPKFPQPVFMHFLLRYALYADSVLDRHDEAVKAIRMTVNTLKNMSRGGIHDHLGNGGSGGGFHRYSVTNDWSLPHFEIMSYDQSQLAIAYLEAFQLTHDQQLSATARGILDYVCTPRFSHPEGGFYSAEDADSYPPKHKPPTDHKREGAYFVWTLDEVQRALSPTDAALFIDYYRMKANGNVSPSNDPHGELTGQNTLTISKTLHQVATMHQTDISCITQSLQQSRATLSHIRSTTRSLPDLDDKIISAWNGLMISAICKGYQVLDDIKYLNAAKNAAHFIQTKLIDPHTGHLLRSYRDTSASNIHGFADDYAYMIQAHLDLYTTTFNINYLKFAEILQKHMDQLFYDEQAGNYYQSPRDPYILYRIKEDDDGAEPSYNSVAAHNLLRLSFILKNDEYRHKCYVLMHGNTRLLQAPIATPMLTTALMLAHQSKTIVVATGKCPTDNDETTSDGADRLIRTVHQMFLPFASVALADGGAGQAYLQQSAPYITDMRPISDNRSGGRARAAVFLCENFTCKQPVTDVTALQSLLQLDAQQRLARDVQQ